jgi:hypothetical protein
MVKEWAMPTWVFLHAWAHSIPEAFYQKNVRSIISILKDICMHLPCPTCAEHATKYLNLFLTEGRVPTADAFRTMMWQFHNAVNLRLNKSIFPKEKLPIYAKTSTPFLYAVFMQHFGKQSYNSKMMLDSMHRAAAVHRLRVWFSKNLLPREPYQVCPYA